MGRRRYGSSGKLWNVGMYDTSRLSATDSQFRYLLALYGRDFRGEGLTVGDASQRIEEGQRLREISRDGNPDMADQLFTNIVRRMTNAANEAGRKWLEANPEPDFEINFDGLRIGVHGMIGAAYLTSPKKGSALYRWMVDHEFDDRRNKHMFPIPHEYTERLEGELQLACCIAALDVFRERTADTAGVRVMFRCDRKNFRYKAAA
jgi:hypothetical protein